MLLAIDTSTAQIGMALYDGSSIPGELFWQSHAHHTEQLAPALAGLLERAGLTIASIRALGVAIGPGSFTSLRVGLAFAKGLTLARHLPLMGIPTLDIVAAGVPLADRKLAAVVQAGRSRLAVGWYKPAPSGWKPEGPATTMTAEELEQKIRRPVIICGELTALDRHHLARKYVNVIIASPAQCVRRPGILAELAWDRWVAGKTDTPAGLAPIYLHVEGGLPV
jgi:tRNA threonylcarbamoyladenosine biosynthesis protein TsaB